MDLHEQFPCVNPLLPLDERVAMRQAGRVCVGFVEPPGDIISAQTRHEAAATLDELDARYPEGPFQLAALRLRMGNAATLQCVSNHAQDICPFQCQEIRRDGN